MIRLEEIIYVLRAYGIYYSINKKEKKFVVGKKEKMEFNIHQNYLKGAVVGDGVPTILKRKFGVEL